MLKFKEKRKKNQKSLESSESRRIFALSKTNKHFQTKFLPMARFDITHMGSFPVTNIIADVKRKKDIVTVSITGKCRGRESSYTFNYIAQTNGIKISITQKDDIWQILKSSANKFCDLLSNRVQSPEQAAELLATETITW